MAIYTIIDVTMPIVTRTKEYTPTADITLVFYCHESNETGHTGLEYDFYIGGRGAFIA
jgi:hypothetical protein